MMATHSLYGFLHSLVSRTRSEGRTDRVLLERFVAERDSAAFAALLERHGRMVLGVCRSVLEDAHLAEDAFQATFLILARKAGSIRKNHAVASWLHGVALRLSKKAKADAFRKNKPDARGQSRNSSEPPSEASCREVQQILHEELDRLPEKYRLPLVLCYLEGRTRDEAAQQLGWSTGSLKGRLERGRERLRALLIGRGIAPAAAASAMLLSDTALVASIPPLLAGAVIQAALRFVSQNSLAATGLSASVTALTEGGMNIMAPKNLATIVTLTLFLGVAATGAGLLAMARSDAEPRGVLWKENAAPAQQSEAAFAVPTGPNQQPDEKRNEQPRASEKLLQPVAAAKSASLITTNLAEAVEMKDFQNSMTLKEVLGLIYEKLQVYGKEFPIVVNSHAFHDANPKGADIHEASIKFQPYPKQMTVGAFIKRTLDQIPTRNATFIVRQGCLEIMTTEQAKVSNLLGQKIIVSFHGEPLAAALRELSGLSGVSIILDPRVNEQANTQVFATFRNDATLSAVLRMLCDMADLRYLDVGGGVYVTTPANAEKMAAELKAQQK